MNADSSGGGRAAAGAVLGGTAGDGWGRAAAYDAYADGLHTYALRHLRDHDAAADAVYCAFVAADRNHTNLQQPEQIQPWLYALLRRECRLRAAAPAAPSPVSARLRPKPDALGESGVAVSLMQLEGNLRRAELQSLAWPEAEGLTPAHREVLELMIRHGLDSRGLALTLGLREGAAGLAPSRGFGLLADAWRELERSLAAAAVAASGRDNCAQLAELTFGWSGKLSAALRAPLTDHVDGCSRCQHYLHTVVGTPSAPTILPFVAAPRALRDILLGELADAGLAESAGVDLAELGRRCGAFGPEGFPARVDLSQGMTSQASRPASAGAGRAPRRRTTATAAFRATAPPPRHLGTPTAPPGAPQASNTGPAPAHGRPRPRVPDADELFRAHGSWAERVLPPQKSAFAATAAVDMNELWRPEPERAFVQTASGRFAARAPSRAGLGAGKPAARPAPATVRPRHRARPMRQAVVSAVALGAVGAVAAAAAAMLGATTDSHSNTVALDDPPSGAPFGHAMSSGPGAGNLNVSVTTGRAGSVLGGAAGRGAGSAASAALSGVPLAAAAPAPPATASSGGFYVSANQRAADPGTVQILLRNAGTAPLRWSAAPTVSWLTLSQSSGTLAAGASTAVTAAAGPGAPSGLWSAQILFSPGGVVVTVHGGIPSSGGDGGAGEGGGTGSAAPPASGSTSPGPASSPTPTRSAAPPASGSAPSTSTTAGGGAAAPGGGRSQTPMTPSVGASGSGTPTAGAVERPQSPTR